MTVTEGPFPETSYGVLKRLGIIRNWLEDAARAPGRGPIHVLDYGCGTGDLLTAPLARAGFCVTGADVHEPSIETARARHAAEGLSFLAVELEQLVRSGLRFDVVICSEVLEHVSDPGGFLRRLQTLLKPDGLLVLTTPNGYGSFEMLRRLEAVLRWTRIHDGVRWAFWRLRSAARRLRGLPAPSRPLESLSRHEDIGFLNLASTHVQFFRARRLERLFAESGLLVTDRRARTLLCGPYVDVLFELLPWREQALALNARIADRLPFSWAADWMYLLERREA